MRRVFAFFSILIIVFIVSGCKADDLQKQVNFLQDKNKKIEAENKQLTEKLALYRKETNPTNQEPKGVTISPEQEYAQNLVAISDFKAKTYDTMFDGTLAGVEFKLKNNGTKTLNEVEVTVYFKNASGAVIGEQKYYPINNSPINVDNNHGPLKPNYVWQIEPGKFLQAKTIPISDWQVGNAEAKVTNVKFAN